jgi:FSR family fosmidomycin resistance protein-like MFS transporter
MSLFSVGGNLGFALGPVMVTPLVLGLGLRGTVFLAVPAALVAAVLARELPRLATFRSDGVRRLAAEGAVEAQWGPFARLGGVILFRTFVYFGLVTFVPLYYVAVLHTSKGEGNAALSLLLLGGAVGTLLGGPLGDRIGRRPVLIGSLVVLPPLLVAFRMASGPLATAILVVIGAATISTFSTTVVMGQEYLPGRIGVASGVTLGLSIGLGGLSAPLLGLLADRYGVAAAIEAITVLPVMGVALALTLPGARRRRDAPAAVRA